MIIDLHIHSNCSSDGEYAPEEILSYVKQKNIEYFAIADHNTISGYNKLKDFNRDIGTVMIPAAEFSTFYGEHEVHVLAYGIDSEDDALKSVFEIINKNKLKQAHERVKALKNLGFKINFDDLMKYSAGNVPSGVTFLNTLLKNEYNKTMLSEYIHGEKSYSPYTSFYFDFFAKGGKSHVHVPLIDINEFFDKMNGRAVFSMAHPGLNPDKIMNDLFDFPFDAVEVFSSYHNAEEVKFFQSVADEYKCFYTAGSDYHGPNVKPNIFMGVDCSLNPVIMEKLLDAIDRRNLYLYNL
ncbi:MAG: PHP domain-containing protein [Flexistipes sinusarabici]|uniref:PHP domain-containing protein n=1 Tax=Flexistipes sinusarabici TaxID=2352 RepID=A0A5D0MWZ0_FLESI|nr:PHP domain-containing protein [Flexistipes sinusarabici]TYB36687.1 MAG: PHP domain-containing protein [Flexistipes sinusarabici]